MSLGLNEKEIVSSGSRKKVSLIYDIYGVTLLTIDSGYKKESFFIEEEMIQLISDVISQYKKVRS